MLTVLVSTVSNSLVFLLKNVSSFCKCKSYSHFFSKNISVYAIFNGQSFNDTLTNNIVSFEQLGPDFFSLVSTLKALLIKIRNIYIHAERRKVEKLLSRGILETFFDSVFFLYCTTLIVNP